MISSQFQASRQQLADGYLFPEEIIIIRKMSKWRLVMSQKNTQIVRNFIEEVFNRKHYDRASISAARIASYTRRHMLVWVCNS